jgi:hypothetical protein
MNENTSQGQIVIHFAHSSCLLPDYCWYNCQRALMDESVVFPCQCHSTIVFHANRPLGDG